jgi:hypothetical protein
VDKKYFLVVAGTWTLGRNQVSPLACPRGIRVTCNTKDNVNFENLSIKFCPITSWQTSNLGYCGGEAMTLSEAKNATRFHITDKETNFTLLVCLVDQPNDKPHCKLADWLFLDDRIAGKMSQRAN